MIKYNKSELEEFMEEFEDGIECGEIEMERFKIAVCKTSTKDGKLGTWELKLDLIEVIETDIYSYQDEKILLIDPNDNTKGFVVFEVLREENLQDLIDYTDYIPELVDPRLKELDVDFYLTSNETYCFSDCI